MAMSRLNYSLGGVMDDDKLVDKLVANAQVYTVQQTPTSVWNQYGSNTALGMLEMRLYGLNLNRGHKFQALTVTKSQKNRTYIVVVVENDTTTVLEDDEDMFPSDKLIAQLRLIKG